MGNSGIGVPLPELAACCREAAAEGAVLLKNEGHMLPVKKDETVSIFGRSQIEYYRSGTGSGGAVNVPYVKNILDGIKENNAFPVNEELVETYKEWLKEHPFDNGGGGWAAEPWHQEEMEITDEIARRAAEKSEKAIFLIGRTAGEDKDYEDTEGSYLLTKREKENLRIVTKYFDEVAVLLNVSNIIDMSWTKDAAYQDHIKAIFYIWQGGMEGANAVADLLSGRVTPSGKLTDTIAEKLSDYPAADHFGSKTENIYAEDIYVGYRYYDKADVPVRFSFGDGLNYPQFAYTDLQVHGRKVSVTITNTGSRAGKETVLCYVRPPQNGMHRPIRELKRFCKIELQPGKSKTVEFALDDRCFAVWHEGWQIPGGHYTIEIGGLTAELPIDADAVKERSELINSWYQHPHGVPSQSEWEKLIGRPYHEAKPQKGTFTMENTVMEMRDQSLVMRIMYHALESVIAKGFDDKKKYNDPNFRMMMAAAADCSLSSSQINGGMRDGIMQGMVEMANGHYLRGILRMIRGE